MGKVTRTLKEVPLEWLRPYENNPRIIDRAVPLVEESIRQVGYITPIVADDEGVILAGHTRFAALKEIGVEKAQVLIVSGATEEQKKKYRLLDNKTGEIATWDSVMLKIELADVDFGGFDFGQPDFSKIDDPQLEVKIMCPRCGAEVTA